MERLQQQYNKEIRPALQKELGFANSWQVPRLKTIVINIGVGKLFRDTKQLDQIKADLAVFAGQQPVATISRNSIAGFKVREGQVVGFKVTLRGDRMYSFLDKLINVALPRVRDFKGCSAKSFDGQGNYHLGIREHTVFPEVPGESVSNIFGLEISILTNAREDVAALALLRKFGFPFVSEK